MIQINLIPDIKREYLKAQRTKGFFITTSFLVSVTSIGLVVLLALFVLGVQGRHSANLKRDIDSKITEIQSADDVDKILTIQNQLISLPNLHETTPQASRIFEYFSQLTPSKVNINNVRVGFGDDTTGELTILELTGVGETFKQVNTFADSLKNAEYTSADFPEPVLAFSDVALDAIGRDDSETTFSLVATFDPAIFQDNIEGFKLSVPKITSSPSVTERPTSLFTRPEAEAN